MEHSLDPRHWALSLWEQSRNSLKKSTWNKQSRHHVFTADLFFRFACISLILLFKHSLCFSLHLHGFVVPNYFKSYNLSGINVRAPFMGNSEEYWHILALLYICINIHMNIYTYNFGLIPVTVLLFFLTGSEFLNFLWGKVNWHFRVFQNDLFLFPFIP